MLCSRDRTEKIFAIQACEAGALAQLVGPQQVVQGGKCITNCSLDATVSLDCITSAVAAYQMLMLNLM